MAAITYRETTNFTAAELETLRGLGLGPVPGAAEAGHGAFQPGHFRLGRGQAYRPGAGGWTTGRRWPFSTTCWWTRPIRASISAKS